MKDFPGIGVKSSPAKSRNKAKMERGIISEVEKRDNLVSIGVDVSKKIIDGKEVVTAKFSQYDYGLMEAGQRRPLNEEYTDLDKFAAALKDRIKAIGKALK